MPYSLIHGLTGQMPARRHRPAPQLTWTPPDVPLELWALKELDRSRAEIAALRGRVSELERLEAAAREAASDAAAERLREENRELRRANARLRAEADRLRQMSEHAGSRVMVARTSSRVSKAVRTATDAVAILCAAAVLMLW